MPTRDCYYLFILVIIIIIINIILGVAALGQLWSDHSISLKELKSNILVYNQVEQ